MSFQDSLFPLEKYSEESPNLNQDFDIDLEGEDGPAALPVRETPHPSPIDDSLTSPVSESFAGPGAELPSSPSGCVNSYRGGGSARGGSYYWRFSWRDRDRVRHAHIPGGSIYAPLAYSRAGILRRLIAHGESIEGILATIEGWRKNKGFN